MSNDKLREAFSTATLGIMRLTLSYTLVLALLMPRTCWGIEDISPVWESVAFVAGTFRVEAKAAFPSYQLTELRIWVSGKRVSVPQSEIRKITNPELKNITATYVTRMPGANHVGLPEAYIKIPFLVENSDGSDTFIDGGVWVLYFEGGKFIRSELQPPRSR